MAKPGLRNLITDVDGVLVGQAEDLQACTGVTVIVPDRPVMGTVCVAGGGPGTRESDVLSAGRLVSDSIDAICLSGGSAFGLAAADGVMAGLKAEGRGFALVPRPGVPATPIVPTAILYDLANGGDKEWGDVAPYAALGRNAFDSAGKGVVLGKAGAGLGAQAGAAPGGTGSASIVTNDGLTIGAIAAVNSFGSVRIPGSDAFWAWPFEIAGEFGGARPGADTMFDPEDWGAAKANPTPRENTTIACIAIDAMVSHDELQRIAQMSLAGMARAIRPVFAPTDGDVVFVISTQARPVEGSRPLAIARLGELAAGTLARAIARGVYEAER
ncbi:P1 family peptidase [Hyphomonas sp. WL0036]|uniref:P1 family peptidase n=1 Tax=Hyphomonas sediminis TaxID=2866160 RepID=UPI001C81AF79|nr:P1 family peptidase [Hyphomonas sediminis]MBY9066414.1 P1 family peptidase [Hyphomonas sediminis]